jgi:hypothetical protein
MSDESKNPDEINAELFPVAPNYICPDPCVPNDAVKWNPWTKVVHCHRCGHVYESRPKRVAYKEPDLQSVSNLDRALTYWWRTWTKKICLQGFVEKWENEKDQARKNEMIHLQLSDMIHDLECELFPMRCELDEMKKLKYHFELLAHAFKLFF